MSIFYEISAEDARFQTKVNRTFLFADTMNMYSKKDLILHNQQEYSLIHAMPLWKSRIEILNQRKMEIFYAGNEILALESQFIKNQNFKSSIIISHLEEESINLVNKIDFFLGSFDSKEIISLDSKRYRLKFNELQNLILALNQLNRKVLKARNTIEEIAVEKSKDLSKASSHAILLAFILEIIIFIYLQFLEVKTERRFNSAVK